MNKRKEKNKDNMTIMMIELHRDRGTCGHVMETETKIQNKNKNKMKNGKKKRR